MSRELSRLTVFDYNDREFLLILEEEAAKDPSGFVSTKVMADRLHIVGDMRMHSTGGRLGHMRKIGAAVKDPARAKSHWNVSPMAKVLIHGELGYNMQQSLERMELPDALLVMRFVSKRQAVAPTTARHLMRREYVSNIGSYR